LLKILLLLEFTLNLIGGRSNITYYSKLRFLANCPENPILGSAKNLIKKKGEF
jgi:hypothetical protein